MNKVLIWDFDGTLVNSYGIIVSAILEQCENYRLNGYTEETVLERVLNTSVRALLAEMGQRVNVDFKEMRKQFLDITARNIDKYSLVSHSKETLEFLVRIRVRNFIFTHNGKSTLDVLKHLDIQKYFEEVVTEEYGLPRKPERGAIDFLVDKYSLDRENTYYVGDRPLDIKCAQNAEINSIFFTDSWPDSGETHRVANLLEIADIVNTPITVFDKGDVAETLRDGTVVPVKKGARQRYKK